MELFKKLFFFENNLFYFILLSLFFHLLAAYFSVGYYQQDEHFSVLEPINYKLGKDSTLGWDYFKLYDRSWFLSYIFYLTTKLVSLFNFNSPFTWTLFYRITASILGWFSIICMIHLSKKILKDKISFYISVIISTLLWFYPYFHARTSSENIGCSFLIIGITFFLFSNKFQYYKSILFLSGLIFGLSFLSRYTNIIPLVFFGFWALMINKNKFNELFITSFGFIIIFILGILIDYWGYNQILLSSFNYFLVNYQHNQMNYFPSHPWWFHFYFIIKEFLPPLSIFVLISIILFWIKLPKNFITWVTLPLFFFLSIISHKETRYLFPILIFTPIFLGFLVENYFIYKKFFMNIFIKYILNLLIGLAVTINFIVLIVLSTTPANNSINLFKFLYNNSYNIEKLYVMDKIPYRKSDLLINFYRNDNLKLVKVFEFEKCPINVLDSNIETPYKEKQIYSYPNWFYKYDILCNKKNFLNNYVLSLENTYFLFSDLEYLNFFNNEYKSQCNLIYNTFPLWTLNYNYNNWLKRTTKWYLYNCNFRR